MELMELVLPLMKIVPVPKEEEEDDADNLLLVALILIENIYAFTKKIMYIWIFKIVLQLSVKNKVLQ